MKRKIGNRVVFVLTLCVACVLALGATIAWADDANTATNSGTNGSFSLTVNIEGLDTPGSAIATDLPINNTQVNVYRIAQGEHLPEYNTYKFNFNIAPFESLESDYNEVATIKPRETTNDNQDTEPSDEPTDQTEEPKTWLTLANAAKGIANNPSSRATPVKDLVKPGDKIDNLAPGLYLVWISDAIDKNSDAVGHKNTYTFTPTIVAVPNKVSEGKTVADTTVDGEWVNNVTDTIINTKWTATPRLGSLVINKYITAYAGEASFVYHVVGTDKNGVKKFEDHRKFTCTQDAMERVDEEQENSELVNIKPIEIHNIPVDLMITVEEIYPGANYRTVIDEDSGYTNPIVIQRVIADGEEGAPVSVSFKNEPTDSVKTGHGVENHFVFDDDTSGGDWLIDVHSIDRFEIKDGMHIYKAPEVE